MLHWIMNLVWFQEEIGYFDILQMQNGSFKINKVITIRQKHNRAIFRFKADIGM